MLIVLSPEVALAICSQYHLSTIETHLKATYKHINHSPKQKIAHDQEKKKIESHGNIRLVTAYTKSESISIS